MNEMNFSIGLSFSAMEQLPSHKVSNQIHAVHSPRNAEGHIWAGNGMYLSLLFFDVANNNLNFRSHFKVGTNLTSISSYFGYEYVLYATTSSCFVRRFKLNVSAQTIDIDEDKNIYKFRKSAKYVSAVNGRVAVACGDDYKVVLLSDNILTKEIHVKSIISTMKASADVVLVGGIDGILYVFNEELDEKGNLNLESKILDIKINKEDAIVVTEDYIYQIDLNNLEITNKEKIEKKIKKAYIEDNEEGKRIVLWTYDSKVQQNASIFLGDFLFYFTSSTIEGFGFPQDDKASSFLANTIIYDENK